MYGTKAGSDFNGDLSIIDNALEFPFPGVTESHLGDYFHRHLSTGNILTKINIAISPAPAVRQKFQSVKFGTNHTISP